MCLRHAVLAVRRVTLACQVYEDLLELFEPPADDPEDSAAMAASAAGREAWEAEALGELELMSDVTPEKLLDQAERLEEEEEEQRVSWVEPL